MDPARTIAVRLVDRSGLDDVRRAAWVAYHRRLALEIVVDYRPPPAGSLGRWRTAAPPELRWRVTGSVCAEALAAEAESLAKHEGVTPEILLEERPRPSSAGKDRVLAWLRHRHREDPFALPRSS